jgi:hypothetical protein
VGFAAVAAGAVLAVGSVACSPSFVTVPTRLEEQFPLLERLGVDLYWNADGCHLLAYARGVFSRDQDPEICSVAGLGSGRPMDAPAEDDFRTVADAFTAAGVSVRYVRVWRDQSGKVGPGSFFIQDGCRTYSLEGDRGIQPEEGALETISPIGGGWYLISSC